MPYRINRSAVQVKRRGKWHTLKTYHGAGARARALQYLRALYANAGERHRR